MSDAETPLPNPAMERPPKRRGRVSEDLGAADVDARDQPRPRGLAVRAIDRRQLDRAHHGHPARAGSGAVTGERRRRSPTSAIRVGSSTSWQIERIKAARTFISKGPLLFLDKSR
jgi:hypothetical protein